VVASFTELMTKQLTMDPENEAVVEMSNASTFEIANPPGACPAVAESMVVTLVVPELVTLVNVADTAPDCTMGLSGEVTTRPPTVNRRVSTSHGPGTGCEKRGVSVP